jgi:hypothetical protein
LTATAEDLVIGGAGAGCGRSFGVQQRSAQWAVVLRVVSPHLRRRGHCIAADHVSDSPATLVAQLRDGIAYRDYW